MEERLKILVDKLIKINDKMELFKKIEDEVSVIDEDIKKKDNFIKENRDKKLLDIYLIIFSLLSLFTTFLFTLIGPISTWFILFMIASQVTFFSTAVYSLSKIDRNKIKILKKQIRNSKKKKEELISKYGLDKENINNLLIKRIKIETLINDALILINKKNTESKIRNQKREEFKNNFFNEEKRNEHQKYKSIQITAK